jgi:hypothetical protein
MQPPRSPCSASPALGRNDQLVAALNQADRPVLADNLQPGDVVVDLGAVHDLGAGAASYLSVKAAESGP